MQGFGRHAVKATIQMLRFDEFCNDLLIRSTKPELSSFCNDPAAE